MGSTLTNLLRTNPKFWDYNFIVLVVTGNTNKLDSQTFCD